jgi:glycosyltransferase involved in cell wall biosynthesis
VSNSENQTCESQIYLLSNGFQPEYEIAFANGLTDLGARVTLISSDSTLVQRAQNGLQLSNLRGSQLEGRTRMAKAWNLLRYWASVLALMRRAPQAIFHFNGLLSTRGPVSNLLEILLIRLFCRHFWFTVHNLVPHDADSPTRRRVNRWIYRMPDVLLVHTLKMKDELRTEWGVDKSKLLHIEHGIEQPLVADPSESENVAIKYAIATDRPLVLCFGNIAPYKGADLMIEALDVAACKQSIRLVILGRGRDVAFLQLLNQLVKAHHLEECVQITDRYVDDLDMPGILHLASIIALPYRRIDQSGVLFTAKAASRPVLATPVGSIAVYMQPDFDWLAESVSPKAIARALDQWFISLADDCKDKVSPTGIERYLWKNTLRPYYQLACTVA